MSYILDALKKADRERELTEVNKFHAVYPMVLNTYRQYPWLLIGIIVTINIILLIVLLWTKTSPSLPIEKPKPIVQSEPTESINVSKIKSTAQLPYAQQDSNGHSNHTDHTMSSTENSELPKKSQLVDSHTIKPALSNSKPIHQSSLTNHAQTVDSPTLPTKTPQNLSPQLAESSTENLPFLKKMSPNFQKSVPVLEINVHVYSSNPQQRFVLINGRRYTEGMHLQEGGILENIRTNDIIINYKQQRFRLERP